jgi:hypothetical protein
MTLAIAANAQTEADLVAPPIRYELSPADIEAKREAYASLSAQTRNGYELVRLAIADCRSMRVEVEKRRKSLKAGVLDYGRKIDSVAAQLTDMLEELEQPLRLKKSAVDEERERVKREAEEARQKEIADKIRAEHEAQQAVFQAARDAEVARLTEERAQLEKERAALAAERAAADEVVRVERELADEARRKVEAQERAAREIEEARMAAERRAMEEERRALAAERHAAQVARERAEAQERAEAEAKARVERERIAAEEARVAELERKAAEEKRLAAIRPDIDRLLDLAAAIRTLPIPDVRSIDAARVVNAASHALGEIADGLVDYARTQVSR